MYTPGGEYARDIGNRATASACSLQREVDTPGSFTQVGHEPLMGRGMNAAIAVHKRYVYVGSRTDGKNNNANHAGVMVVDAQDPAHPFIAKRDGPAVRGQPAGVLARAARVALAERADRPAHQLRRRRPRTCARRRAARASASTTSRARTPTNPQLLYQNTLDTHEFYIWEDPKNPKRALLFAASAGSAVPDL